MTAVPAQSQGPSDADLITSVRSGDTHAYGSLYQRHVAAAYNLARQVSRSPSEADDLVSETFAKVLDTLRAGKGPDSAFRAYLLTALRHTAYDKTRRDRKVELTDDVTTSGAPAEAISVPFSDTAVAGLDRSLAARAFASLPERWQTVLWHTEVEGAPPAEVAPILGISPNGVSALAYRAREGLRQAYLQVHLAETSADRCRATVDRLGAWTRGGLSKRETAQVEAHLDECERCRALAAELADVNGALRAILGPLVLGGAAAAYLATVGTTAVHVGAAAGAGSAAGAAGAVSSLPRQLTGVGVGAAAVAAAVAVAMTANTGPQQIQAAQPPPTVAPKPPAPPAPKPPAPKPPAPPAPPPAPPPAAPPPAPKPPAPQPPAPKPPAPAPKPPAPGSPKLTAAGPTNPVALEPGGQAEDVPLTVTNNGSAPSGPVSAMLKLPPGVSAIGQGQRFGGPSAFALDAPPPAAGTTVNCPSGTGTVHCTSDTGLQPGETVTLLFRLKADESAQGGQVTGSITATGAVTVTVNVPVKVNTPPPKKDGVDVFARQVWLPFLPLPFVAIDARNTGQTTAPLTIRYDKASWTPTYTQGFRCASGAHDTTCVSTWALKPGQGRRLNVLVPISLLRPTLFNTTGRIGSAHDSASVLVRPPISGPAPVPDPTPDPTSTPGTSTSPAPSTEEPTSPSRPPSTSETPPPSESSTPSAPPTTTTRRPTPSPRPSSPSTPPNKTPDTHDQQDFWLFGWRPTI